MNQRIRLRNTQIRQQHSRLHIHRLLFQFLPAPLRVLMKHHIAIPIRAHLRNGHAEVGNLQEIQLRLLRNRIQVRIAHQRMVDRQHAAPRHEINHIHQQIAGDPHQNIRFEQRAKLLRLAHLVHHDRFIPPNLRFTRFLRPYRHFPLKQPAQFVHVADAPAVALRVFTVRYVQNHRRCGRRELLVDVVVAIRGDANRVGFVEIEMDRSLARVANRRRDRLEGREKRRGDELAEAEEAGREVGAVEKVEGVRGGVEGLENGEIFVGVGVFGFA